MWHGDENSQTMVCSGALVSGSSSFGSCAISASSVAVVVGQGVPFSSGSVVAGDAG